MRIILLISVVVAFLTCGILFLYDTITFRERAVRQVSSMGGIVAANSTAALAFDNSDDATAVLEALAAEPNLRAAALYREDGSLFATYPAEAEASHFPSQPGSVGHRFEPPSLIVVQPVLWKGNRLGTLYLESDMALLYDRFIWYGGLVSGVILVSILVAYLLSRKLQQQISRPVMVLAESARAVSERGDYSVRAVKNSEDELGELTDAFNHMLEEIQNQHRELRDNESRLYNTVENLTEGLVMSDLDGRLLHFNRAALDLHGFSSFDECQRHLSEFTEIFELTHLDGKALAYDDWPLSRILRGEILTGLELRVRRKMEPVWERIHSFNGAIVPDSEGRPMVAVVTINDITASKEKEAEIRQLNASLEERVARRTAELQAANDELESFSYSVSHDLRAPLRHIDGFSQLLKTRVWDSVDDTAKRHLNVISDSSKRLGRLIDELLAFSRTGRAGMNPSTVDTLSMVETVREELNQETNGRSIDWQIDDLPEVHADPSLLRQVWANLIGNAIKYSSNCDKALIEVTHWTDPEDGHVFRVRDNGAGFEMQYVNKLFGVFQRLHSDSDFEGTGIGLANVRRIVQRHNGRVWAEGKLDEGASFYFTLPIKSADQNLKPKDN